MTKAQLILHSYFPPNTWKIFGRQKTKRKPSEIDEPPRVLRDKLFGPMASLTKQNDKRCFHSESIRSWHFPEGSEKALLCLFACFEYISERGREYKEVTEILKKYGWLPTDDSDVSNNFENYQALGKAFSYATRREVSKPNEQFKESYQNALVQREEFENISDAKGKTDISYWQNTLCPEVRVRLWGSAQLNARLIRTSLEAILPSNLRNSVRRALEHDSIAGHFIEPLSSDSCWLSYSDSLIDFIYAVGKKNSCGGWDENRTRFYSIVASKDFKTREDWSNYQFPEIYLGISNFHSCG